MQAPLKVRYAAHCSSMVVKKIMWLYEVVYIVAGKDPLSIPLFIQGYLIA